MQHTWCSQATGERLGHQCLRAAPVRKQVRVSSEPNAQLQLRSRSPTSAARDAPNVDRKLLPAAYITVKGETMAAAADEVNTKQPLSFFARCTTLAQQPVRAQEPHAARHTICFRKWWVMDTALVALHSKFASWSSRDLQEAHSA